MRDKKRVNIPLAYCVGFAKHRLLVPVEVARQEARQYTYCTQGWLIVLAPPFSTYGTVGTYLRYGTYGTYVPYHRYTGTVIYINSYSWRSGI